MTNKEAIEILEEAWRVNTGIFGNFSSAEALELAIKALDLLGRLEGFKYVTTAAVLKEEQKLEHFDIYKTGWNDAIEAIKKASDRPLSEIINVIKFEDILKVYGREAEAKDSYNKAD